MENFMQRRPLDGFIRRFRVEEPPDNLRRKLINRFKRGGLDGFESNIIKVMGDIKLVQVMFTDPITKERLLWKYVGELWWCRQRKDCYEFSRLVAYVNKSGRLNEVEGLWDARRHVTKQQPVIMYRGDVKGFVVGYNDFEVLVEWYNPETGLRSLAEPVRSIDNIRFEFVEDHKKFSKVFSNICKNVRVVKKPV
jgi:hypothetical protein